MYVSNDQLVGVIINAMSHREYSQLIIISLLHQSQRHIHTFARIAPARGKYKLNFTIWLFSSGNLKTERIIAFELNWTLNPNENSDIRNGVENSIRNGVENYVRTLADPAERTVIEYSDRSMTWHYYG